MLHDSLKEPFRTFKRIPELEQPHCWCYVSSEDLPGPCDGARSGLAAPRYAVHPGPPMNADFRMHLQTPRLCPLHIKVINPTQNNILTIAFLHLKCCKALDLLILSYFKDA